MDKKFSTPQLILLVVLRFAIGWHFLYEGLVKLFMPEWSAASYLEVSTWIFAPLFHWMAETPSVLAIVDVLNIWGLILIGAALLLGVFTRLASIGGMVLLALYYVANPPFVGLDFGVPQEGHYLVVNKTLIEFFALGICAIFSTGHIIGFEALWKNRRTGKAVSGAKKTAPSEAQETPSLGRRALIKGLITVPIAGAFGYAWAKKQQWQSYEEQNLVDAMTSATTKLFNPATLRDLKGQIPKAKINGQDFSRLILGGNLLSGYAHSRDLIYVSQLVKAYHNKDKIFATLLMAEKCGINTLLTNPILCTLIDEYWKRGIGKIQFISDCAGLDYDENGAHPTPFNEYLDRIKRAIDYGATACYIQGETADYYMQHDKVDALAKAMQLVQDNNVTLGIGAHHIETIQKCVEAGFEPDFWMKTMHHHNYWSAKHEQWHDNKYCFHPEKTIEYMKTLPQPWIAFKVMAAGSIHPSDAFRYAWESGADFICAGMYDFQMVEDANIALQVLNSEIKREREWRA